MEHKGNLYKTLHTQINEERIFPWHLLLKSDESAMKELYNNQMHKYENYNYKDKKDYEFLNNNNTRKLHQVASKNREYNFVDVVMESSNGYQYVIPFIAVDVKNLHHNMKIILNIVKSR